MPKRAVVIEPNEMCPAGLVAETATCGYTMDRIVVDADRVLALFEKFESRGGTI